MISPCACTGTMAYVHKECLEKWITFSQRSTCELCHTSFDASLVRLPSLRQKCFHAPITPYTVVAAALGTMYAIGTWVDTLFIPVYHWQVFMASLIFVLAFLSLWVISIVHLRRRCFCVTGVWFATFVIISIILHTTSRNLDHPNLFYIHIINTVIASACVGSECVFVF